jgi:hypothetical protein
VRDYAAQQLKPAIGGAASTAKLLVVVPNK